MNKIEYYFSTLSLFPFKSVSVFEDIKLAGFHGVEILLPPRFSIDFMSKVQTEASKCNLGIRFHEVWSLENNPCMFNRVACLLGTIPPKTEPLHMQIPNQATEIVTCYAWRNKEIIQSLRQKRLLQTCNTYDHTIAYHDFLKIVREGNFGVVFDTQHLLEMWNGGLGVHNLRILSRSQLNGILQSLWDNLAPYVVEIHFNNFCISKSHALGRNCWPDQGILDLRSFAKMVVKSGWRGIVVPEVTPRYIHRGIPIPGMPFTLPLWKPRIRELHNLVSEMFS